MIQGEKEHPSQMQRSHSILLLERELSHLLEVVDEHHVEGLIPATIEEEVEAIHLQEMAMWALVASP